jgi:hypothetical protein
MKLQFKYGISTRSLLVACLTLAALALAAMGLAATLDEAVSVLGVTLAPASAAIVAFIVGGFFAVAAGIVVSLMIQQRGMSRDIVLDSKKLILPVTGLGEVTIPLAELTGWQVRMKETRKSLVIEHAGQSYTVDRRLMASDEDFEGLAAALRARAASKERPEVNK